MRTQLMVLVVCAIGCGGGDSAAVRPKIDVNQDNFCGEVAKVACFDLYQCCSESEIERFLGVSDPRTLEQCLSDVARLCERRIANYEFSLANQHIRFDAGIMGACLNALLAPMGTCATVASSRPWVEPCMKVAWVGIVPDGSQCDFPYECSVDSFCSPGRVCTARPGDGMPCLNLTCASGLYCNAGTCRPLLGAGSMCTSNTQCMKGLYCDTTVVPSACAPLHNAGERCSGNNSCMSNQCLPGTCAGTGQTCFTDSSCFGHCANSSLSCTTDRNCGTGTCSMTATICNFPTDCTGVGNTCVFPVMCIPGTCTGDIVCADAHAVVDYCGAVSSLPLP